MTLARKYQIDLEKTPYYHCISRCVRRSFLCGHDRVSGLNFDHRRQWMVDRMKLLTTVFSIRVVAYAIMSNHFHLILDVDQEDALALSDQQVIDRWAKLSEKPDDHALNEDQWLPSVADFRRRFFTMVGPVKKLVGMAQDQDRHRFNGFSGAEALYRKMVPPG